MALDPALALLPALGLLLELLLDGEQLLRQTVEVQLDLLLLRPRLPLQLLACRSHLLLREREDLLYALLVLSLRAFDLLLQFLPERADFLRFFGGLRAHAADGVVEVLPQLRNLLLGGFDLRLFPAFPLLQGLLDHCHLLLGLYLFPPPFQRGVPGRLLQLLTDGKQLIIHLTNIY